MKHIFSLALVVASLTACSKPEEAVAPAPAPAPADVSASAGSSVAPAAPTTFTPPPPSPTQQPVDIEAGGEKRMSNGEIAQNDIDYLNALVKQLNEAHGTWSTDATPSFKSAAEKQAYDDAIKKFKEPITDLQELVKARLIKKIPAAPAGKKYVINPTSHQVELANQ